MILTGNLQVLLLKLLAEMNEQVRGESLYIQEEAMLVGQGGCILWLGVKVFAPKAFLTMSKDICSVIASSSKWHVSLWIQKTPNW